MSHTWVMVANSANARIFEAKNNNELHEILQLEHPESRMKASELVTDRQGRGHESVGTRRSAMEPSTTPKEVEFAAFAKFLSEHLDSAHNAGKFNKLYIAAGPHFLGLMRDVISPSLAHCIVGTLDKDFTHLEPKQIRSHLPDIL